MKRLLLVALFQIVSAIVFAQSVKVDGITYKVKSGEAYVWAADIGSERIKILASVEIDGRIYPVTTIGLTKGFTAKCPFAGNQIVKFVSIPNTVTKIAAAAFLGCTNLRELVVPDSPIEISKGLGYFMGSKKYLSFVGCTSISVVKCHNGEIPRYMVEHLPQNSPFVLAYNNGALNAEKKQEAQQYAQQIGNNVQLPHVELNNTTTIEKSSKPSSDVDKEIPEVTRDNENTFAVIFANEDYSEEEDVEYAHNDGEMFKEYCHKVLGMPEDNVHIRKDATLNHIKAEISWMQQVAKAYNGQARFIVFYAGHGIPDEKSATAYLLPVDGKGTMLDTGYSLAKFYEALAAMPAERVTVFMDACFSGSKRGDGMLTSARGVAIKAKAQTPKGKMVVFSAAQGDETAYPLKDKEHGLFTYYLLKKLKETKGNVTYGELGDYIMQQVSRKSIVANGKSQSPTVTPSQTVAANWKTMKLR